MSKRRSDSPLNSLTPEQAAQLAESCVQDGYVAAAALATSQFGIATSKSSVERWFSWWRLEQRYSAARENASRMEELMQQAGQFSAEQVRSFGQRVFMEAAVSSEDPETFMELSKLQLKEQALAHEREKFQFDAATSAMKHAKEIRAISADRTLNDSQKVEQVIMKLFGQAPEAMLP